MCIILPYSIALVTTCAHWNPNGSYPSRTIYVHYMNESSPRLNMLSKERIWHKGIATNVVYPQKRYFNRNNNDKPWQTSLCRCILCSEKKNTVILKWFTRITEHHQWAQWGCSSFSQTCLIRTAQQNLIWHVQRMNFQSNIRYIRYIRYRSQVLVSMFGFQVDDFPWTNFGWETWSGKPTRTIHAASNETSVHHPKAASGVTGGTRRGWCKQKLAFKLIIAFLSLLYLRVLVRCLAKLSITFCHVGMNTHFWIHINAIQCHPFTRIYHDLQWLLRFNCVFFLNTSSCCLHPDLGTDY